VAITNHVAVSLETARAAQLDAEVRAAQQQRDLAETMLGAIAELSSSLDPEQVLDRMLHTVTRAVQVDSACLLRADGAERAGIVATLAGQAMIAYDKALAFQRVQQLATQDGLTGVANRRHLLEQAEHQFTGAEPGGDFTAIMVDVDHFKRINDTYGHQVGDEV